MTHAHVWVEKNRVGVLPMLKHKYKVNPNFLPTLFFPRSVYNNITDQQVKSKEITWRRIVAVKKRKLWSFYSFSYFSLFTFPLIYLQYAHSYGCLYIPLIIIQNIFVLLFCIKVMHIHIKYGNIDVQHLFIFYASICSAVLFSHPENVLVPKIWHSKHTSTITTNEKENVNRRKIHTRGAAVNGEWTKSMIVYIMFFFSTSAWLAYAWKMLLMASIPFGNNVRCVCVCVYI